MQEGITSAGYIVLGTLSTVGILSLVYIYKVGFKKVKDLYKNRKKKNIIYTD